MIENAEEPNEPLTFEEMRKVQRESHQLSISHGRNAHLYALRLAQKAESEKNVGAARVWRAVYSSLRIR